MSGVMARNRTCERRLVLAIHPMRGSWSGSCGDGQDQTSHDV
jgi:hypothetical protein